MYFDLKSRRCSIDKPALLGKTDKVLCFIDFRMQNISILAGGRIIEYSAIKIKGNKIEIFHSLACPSKRVWNDKVAFEMHESMSERLGIHNDVLHQCRNTFRVFEDFYEFLKDVDICYFYDHMWTLSIMKYYLIELKLEIPKIWMKDIKGTLNRQGFGQVIRNEWNGFARAYKVLLWVDGYEGRKIRECRWKGLRRTFWSDRGPETQKKLSDFEKELVKHRKWLLKGRMVNKENVGVALKKWLDEHDGISPIMRKRMEDNVQKGE